MNENEGTEHEKKSQEPAEAVEHVAAPAPTAAVVDQAALAEKVEALLGEKDDLEALARAEEAKLEARTGGRGKAALEEAATKRLAEIGTKKAKKPEEVEAAEAARRAAVSSALATPDRMTDFVTKHRKTLGMVAGAVAVGLTIVGGLSYAAEKKRERASAELAQAFSALEARIVTPEQAKLKTEDDPTSDGPTYGSADERAEATVAKLESVEKNHGGSGAAFIAELTRASVLAGQGKYAEALAVYQSVKKTPLGRADIEISLRAAEGIGAAHEALALRSPEKKKEELEAALASYKELIDSDALGFAELGQYHTARVYEQQGETEKAKELYQAVYKKVTKPSEDRPLGTYLEAVVTLRLQAIDPTFEPPRKSAMGGTSQLDEAQIKKLLEELKKNPGKGGPVEGDGH